MEYAAIGVAGVLCYGSNHYLTQYTSQWLMPLVGKTGGPLRRLFDGDGLGSSASLSDSISSSESKMTRLAGVAALTRFCSDGSATRLHKSSHTRVSVVQAVLDQRVALSDSQRLDLQLGDH